MLMLGGVSVATACSSEATHKSELTARTSAAEQVFNRGIGSDGTVQTPTYVNVYWDTSGPQFDADVAAATDTVTGGPGPSMEQIEAITEALIRSDYLSGLGQYGISNWKWAAGIVLGDACPDPSISMPPPDTNTGHNIVTGGIPSCLQTAFDHRQFDTSQLVVNYIYPPQVKGGGDNGLCKSANGYHDHSGGIASTFVPLNVNCTSNDMSAFLISMSHEMVEATTDCEPANPNEGYRSTGFYVNGPDEIADLCEKAPAGLLPFEVESSFFNELLGGTLDDYFSNNDNVCIAGMNLDATPTATIIASGRTPNLQFRLNIASPTDDMTPPSMGGNATNAYTLEASATVQSSSTGKVLNVGGLLRGDTVFFEDIEYQNQSPTCNGHAQNAGDNCNATVTIKFGQNVPASPFDIVTFLIYDPETGLAATAPGGGPLRVQVPFACDDGSDPLSHPPVFAASVNAAGTSGCDPNASGMIPIPFPTATSRCTPGEVTVTGEILALDDVMQSPAIPLPDAAHSFGPPRVHKYTVAWTATDALGQTTIVTQFINAPESGPNIVEATSGPLVATCTPLGLLVTTFPLPTITTAEASCTATTTGAITAENGFIISPLITLAKDGSADAPPGTDVVTWTATDSLGFSTLVNQTFQVETNGPCFSAVAGNGGWAATAGNPCLIPGTQPGGGPGTGLGIMTPNGWNQLLSAQFSTTGLIVGPDLEYDLYLPTNLVGQGWWGGVQAKISIPSANIYNQFVGGNTNLKGSNLPLGQFSTIKVPLPSNIATALSQAHSDVSVEIDLNAPMASPPIGPWYLENFRFGK
jgi:hypothetical protein